MATHAPGVFESNLNDAIKNSKILVVGAGGIGCELLKNLVLTGFEDIEVIDLDTIDVSNLNRQFLFQKEHVGKSKSKVARESALRFNPKANIISHHDSILSPEYSTSFYKKFNLVMNALDNRTARNHVNRMCLSSEIPLVESGTAGYLGQVTVIKRGMTECYECQPKAAQKTFPGCTIRNTPSEPIHCIVWAKHLFNQLFGESDPDEDVSPDSADPEQVGEAGQTALQVESESTGNITRVSTRQWAMSHDFDPQKLFRKLFHDDIQYLLSMDKLWQKRRPPTPLEWDDLPKTGGSSNTELIRDQRAWSIEQCRNVFERSIKNLHKLVMGDKQNEHLVWDKDDEDAMDFVTSCANIRAHIFGIPQKTRFDIKSMAGNIIPAIATTNAVIAGLIVLEGMKILDGKIDTCKTTYLNRKPNPKKRLLVPCTLDKPNPKCYVCAPKPELHLQINVEKMTVKTLEEKVLKSALNMVAPDVEINGNIILSSEPGETESNNDKTLSVFNIREGSILSCDDFVQKYSLFITLIQNEKFDGVEFEVIGDPEKLQKEQADAESSKDENKEETTDNKKDTVVDDDDDLMVIDDEAREGQVKRKADENAALPKKKQKVDTNEEITLE